MRITAVLILTGFILMPLHAQDKSYNTDELKKLKRISTDEWKRLKEDAGVRAQRNVSANAADLSMQSAKGRIIVKSNQTLELKNETELVLDYLVSGGQDAKGTPTVRSRYAFKIGPGKYEIKDGFIKRIE